MTSAVRGNATNALALESPVPAKTLPVFLSIGRKPVNEQHRAPVAGTNVVEGDLEFAGAEFAHSGDCGGERQRDTVHAVPQARWLRPIIKHMTKVTGAPAAMNFRTHLEDPTLVDRRSHGTGQRLIKARPARSTLEFRGRGEERQRAARAPISALAMLAVQGTRPRGLRPLVPQHIIGLRRELFLPFRVGMRDLERL